MISMGGAAALAGRGGKTRGVRVEEVCTPVTVTVGFGGDCSSGL